jgi:hypothetical protein
MPAAGCVRIKATAVGIPAGERCGHYLMAVATLHDTQLTRIAPQRYFRGQETRAYVREAEASVVGLDVQHHNTRTTAPPHHRTTAPPHHRTTAPPHRSTSQGDPVRLTRYLILQRLSAPRLTQREQTRKDRYQNPTY